MNNGPTAHVTITSTDGSVTNGMLALNPDGDRNDCALATCEWSADINNLARGDVVSYYITASDAHPPTLTN